LAVVLMSLGFDACVGADKVGRRAPISSRVARVNAEQEAAVRAQISRGATRGYLNDGDGDGGGARESRGYHDPDENPLSFSAEARVASVSEARTITTLVRRYLALLTAGDGARACSMLPASVVAAMPLTYGKYGPPYLLGAKTCQAVMTRMFKHARSEWSGRVAVTGVVVMNADHTAAMLGSVRAPASNLVFQRERGGWRIASPLPSATE
jgi:hypothetical protein